ncbi:hypothetical protein QRD02_11155 [Aequorivita sp. SDUM287046]|uniref:Glyoxalase n=1 Tax=Aequorivita aurantiaca TaxID=3053356 RepID=A0ABT8DNW3_9FLAO|nr:hypothetical protein [Aequorivita aurantiaca]MDN3724943.1 hypothetical protein [Aequorivita aurantiaca]
MVFITFPGNCKKALTFYQSCFGGNVKFEPFPSELQHFNEIVVSGSLLSEKIIIHGSDLVHTEGRKLGNSIAIFFGCNNVLDRTELVAKLAKDKKRFLKENCSDQKLIELTDAFDVRWVLGVNEE